MYDECNDLYYRSLKAKEEGQSVKRRRIMCRYLACTWSQENHNIDVILYSGQLQQSGAMPLN